MAEMTKSYRKGIFHKQNKIDAAKLPELIAPR